MNDPITILKVCFTVYFVFKYDSVYTCRRIPIVYNVHVYFRWYSNIISHLEKVTSRVAVKKKSK